MGPIIMILEEWDGKSLVGFRDDAPVVYPVMFTKDEDETDDEFRERRRESIRSHLMVLTGRQDLRFCFMTREEWEAYYKGVDIEAARVLSRNV
jgi:hypothetical protein